MTDLEIKQGLLSLEPRHPFMQSLNALMEQAVSEEQDAVTNPGLADGARHFNAGRLAHAKDFRGAIAGIIEEARREREEELRKAESRKLES